MPILFLYGKLPCYFMMLIFLRLHNLTLSPHIKVWLAERQHRAVGLRQQATLAKAEAVRPLNAKYFDSAIDTFRNELSRDTQRLF